MAAYYLSLVVPILAVVGAFIFQFPEDMKIAEKDFGTKNKWQRLNKKGKRYVVFSILALIIGETILIIKGQEIQKTIILKQPRQTNVVYVPHVVRDTQKIKEKYTEKIVNPVMETMDDSTRIRGRFPDSVRLRFFATCINQGIAYHVLPHIVAFGFQNGKYRFLGANGALFNTDEKSYLGHHVYLEIGIDFIKKNLVTSDTDYFYYSATYYNKEIKGTKQPKLRKFYYMTPKINNPQSLQDFEFKEIIVQHVYQRVKSTMIKYKYW